MLSYATWPSSSARVPTPARAPLELQVRAFGGREHFEFPLAGLVPGPLHDVVERLVGVLGLVVEQRELLCARFLRQLHRLGPGRVPPALVARQLVRRVHPVVEEQVAPADE